MNKIIIKDKILGKDNDTLICAPMTGSSLGALSCEVAEIRDARPDILEWRADYFDVSDASSYESALNLINNELSEYPLIITPRSYREGGVRKIEDDTRLNLIISALATGVADFVDVELRNDENFVFAVLEAVKRYNAKIILSYHDFEKTPLTSEIAEYLRHAHEIGADIVKIAVMPKCPGDVLDLFIAVREFHAVYPNTPVISMAMGNLGVISRIDRGLFGSAVTYAALRNASAPGQLSVNAVREITRILNSEMAVGGNNENE